MSRRGDAIVGDGDSEGASHAGSGGAALNLCRRCWLLVAEERACGRGFQLLRALFRARTHMKFELELTSLRTAMLCFSSTA